VVLSNCAVVHLRGNTFYHSFTFVYSLFEFRFLPVYTLFPYSLLCVANPKVIFSLIPNIALFFSMTEVRREASDDGSVKGACILLHSLSETDFK